MKTREQVTSPELQTLLDAVQTYVDHYDGKVDLVLSLFAFDDMYKCVEDRQLYIGEALDIDIDSLQESLHNHTGHKTEMWNSGGMQMTD